MIPPKNIVRSEIVMIVSVFWVRDRKCKISESITVNIPMIKNIDFL